MTFKDLLDAVVGYYLIVLAVSAAAGVRESLRDPAGTGPDPATPGAPPAVPGSSTAPTTRSGRFGALVHGRTLHAAHRFGWATGVGLALGWATGLEVYRAGRRHTAAAARRARDWNERRRAARDTAAPDTPGIPDADGGPQPVTAPEPPPTGPAPEPVDTGPADTEPGTGADAGAADAPAPILVALRRLGRVPLHLVPKPQEYPDTMAADITDLESLVHFTGQTAQVAGMESEDAAAASASMIAGAEFAGETAARVTDETTSLEHAVAVMAMLRVDPESTAAYHALLEAGQVYRDQTATFSAQCHDAAATASVMAAAAANYHETARTALAVLSSHQMPHAEAAMATGHSGAHGAFYGVADTGGQDALPGSGAPQLPAS